MRQFFLIVTLILLAVLQMQKAFAATAITGTITEKRGDSVKVEFQAHKTVVPKIGDKVEFSTLLQGIKVNAGVGKVTIVDEGAVWVKVTDNRPKPKMTGIITATGTPSAGTQGSRDKTIKSSKVPSKEPRQSQVSSGKAMSQDDIKNAVIQELIRLRYLSKESAENLSADTLQQSIDICGVRHGFPSGRQINGELLNFLQKLEPW